MMIKQKNIKIMNYQWKKKIWKKKIIIIFKLNFLKN